MKTFHKCSAQFSPGKEYVILLGKTGGRKGEKKEEEEKEVLYN